MTEPAGPVGDAPDLAPALEPLTDPAPTGRERANHVLRATGAALTPVLVALVIGGIVLRVSGIDPFATYALMARNAFGSVNGLAGTLTSATPLLFTGLATAIAFRAGVFTMGAEAGFVLGGLAAAWLAVLVPGPPILVGLVAMAGAMVAGLLFALPPALLKVRLGVDEVVSTLMLNFAAVAIAAWIVNAYLLAPGAANSSTASIPFGLTKLMPPASLNIGFLIALVLIVIYGVFLRYTSQGLELHHVGVDARFSAAQGVRVGRVVLIAMLMTGAIAGLGGAVHAMGVVGKFVATGFSASYGFTGIAVALLARRSALGIIPAALLFGAFANAGTTIQLFDSIPLDIVSVLQGTVMMFAVAHISVSLLHRRRSVTA